jgi:3-hydroxyacyl-CoA dehydrogenase
MLLRIKGDPRTPKGPMPAVAKAFEMIGTAQVAKSAFEAKEMGILRKNDGITMNRDRLLADAKAKVLELVKGHKGYVLPELVLPGASGAAALDLALHDFVLKGMATKHDVVVAKELAKVLTGGVDADMTVPVPAAEILKLERAALVKLAHTRGTRARIAHLLKTGKPLRN